MMEATDDVRLHRALDSVYDAAVQPENWPHALAAIAAVFGDVGANLSYYYDDGRFGAVVSPSLAAGVADYNETWWKHDIRAQRAVERALVTTSDAVTDRDFVSEDEMATHPFYTEFLARFGLRYFAGLNILPDPHVQVALTIQRAADKPPFSDAELARFKWIGRHAEQSMRLSLRLIDSDIARTGLQDALARLGVAVFLLDGQERVVFANQTADRLIGRGLTKTNDRLIASGRESRARFSSAIMEAVGNREWNLQDNPRPVVIDRPGGTRPLIAYFLSIRGAYESAAQQLFSRVRAAVLVIDTEGQSIADPALVRDVLGLTASEARVAALIGAGCSPRDIAGRLNLAEETIRTALKRVFSKTGVSRQSELVVLLNRISLGNSGSVGLPSGL